mmetsp:Transcript_24757/g.65821  ORF Transcript_24757/g.65821 Transcript_24757/m.65821 type:complete len:236 (-) Transcript_24757:174-881(-)
MACFTGSSASTAAGGIVAMASLMSCATSRTCAICAAAVSLAIVVLISFKSSLVPLTSSKTCWMLLSRGEKSISRCRMASTSTEKSMALGMFFFMSSWCLSMTLVALLSIASRTGPKSIGEGFSLTFSLISLTTSAMLESRASNMPKSSVRCGLCTLFLLFPEVGLLPFLMPIKLLPWPAPLSGLAEACSLDFLGENMRKILPLLPSLGANAKAMSCSSTPWSPWSLLLFGLRPGD